jgi:hypothetical protein
MTDYLELAKQGLAKFQAGTQQDHVSVVKAVDSEERAAIMQNDGGLSKTEAERRAIDLVFRGFFLKAARELGQQWQPGTGHFTELFDEGLWRSIQNAWSRMDEVWLAARKGEAGSAEFQAVLEQWANLNHKAMALYSPDRFKGLEWL